MKIGRLNRSVGQGSKVGCVLALDLKKKDGASFMDRSVYGHLCTNYGSKWQLDGRYFDGVDDYVDCGNDASLNITDAITIKVWVRPVLPYPNDYPLVLTSSLAWGRPEFAGYTAGHYYYRFCGKMADGSTFEISSPNLISGRCYHFVGTYDGSYARFYIDGDKIGSQPKTGKLKTPAGTVQIGSRSGSQPFRGLAAVARIDNFADYIPRILSRSIGG